MGVKSRPGWLAAAEDDIRLQRPGPKRFNLRSTWTHWHWRWHWHWLGWWGRFVHHSGWQWKWHRRRTYVVRVKGIIVSWPRGPGSCRSRPLWSMGLPALRCSTPTTI